jgi:hypothetical protein
MTTTTALVAPNRPRGGVNPHGVEPSRWLTALGLLFLAIGFLVDLAAFRGALALVATDLDDNQVTFLAAAAGLMALFLMFEAGYMESERREETMGSHGKGIIRTLQGIWLLAGVAATFIRLTAEPEASADVFAGASAGAPATDPFGNPIGDPLAGGTPTGIDLGVTTIYPEHLPTALFMLVLYLGVGIGAYIFGRRFYSPLLTDVRRKRRVAKQQARALAKLRQQREAAAARAGELSRASDEISTHHAEVVALQALEAALVAHQEARARRADTSTLRLVAEQGEARLTADVEALPGQVLTETRTAEAIGRAAEQHARTLLHRHLGEPSRTVMDSDTTTLHNSSTDSEA